MKLLITILLIGVCAVRALASEVKLTWTASPDPTVTGYRIYCVYDCSTGSNQISCTNVVDVGDGTSATISGLSPSTIYSFAVTDYDVTDAESDFSNWITYTTPAQLSLGTWTAIAMPALVSTDLVTWSPTNFSVLLTNTAVPFQFFRFLNPSMIFTNKQPGQP